MTTMTDTSGFIIELNDEDPTRKQTLDKRTPGNVSTLLRTFGAIAVIASLSLFLIEGWTDGNDLNRYFKLLAQTGLITGAGLFLSTVVKEAKGARVFFGLGLIAAVANFTILGALIYSIAPLDNAQGDYSSMLKWQAVSLSKLIPLGIGTFAVMGLLAKFSFTIFARSASGKLTAVFTVLCALLLVPAREAMFVAPLAAIALFVAIQTAIEQLKSDTFAKTAEAKFALATLFLPGGIIICRSLGLYAVDELVLLTICGSIYHALRSTHAYANTKTLQHVMMLIQSFAGAGAALSLASLVAPHWEAGMLLVACVSMMIVLFDVSYARDRANTNDVMSPIILISTLVMGIANALCALASPALDFQVVSIINMLGLIGLTFVLQKFDVQTGASRIVSIVGFAICLAALGFDLIAHLNVGTWALFGIGGVSLIVLGSLHERFGASLKSAE